MKGLVSIIMPAYNAAKHISESIESVLGQTYSEWELVIVDDGSTDETAAIVSQYVAQDKRIKYLYQVNARQGRARNNGIEHSSGEYIAFLDSDDLWLPEKLQFQVQELEKSNADLLFTDSYVFQKDFQLNYKSNENALARIGVEPGVFQGEKGIKLFLVINRIPILTVLTKRIVLNSVGGFNESKEIQNAEDYHLWLKLLLNGFRLVGLDKSLAAYRLHSSSVSDADGINYRQAVEAKFSLLKEFPAQKELIESSVKYTILMSLNSVHTYCDKDYYRLVERYLEILQVTEFKLVFNVLHKAGARSLSLRLIYFLLNHFLNSSRYNQLFA